MAFPPSGQPTTAHTKPAPRPTRFAKFLGCALAGSAALAGGAVAAEVDPFSLEPEQLFDAMVVSVSRTEERIMDAPAAIFVLDDEDIIRSGATSIPEALRLVPGVQVARGNASGWAISVRGFNGALTNKLLVLIDGRVVYDPLFSGVYWDIQDTALPDIDRIEVIRGPGATLWGANAVNGVINIITKSAAATQGPMLSASLGDDDRALITARFGGMAGPDLSWRIYGKYTERDSNESPSGFDADDAWSAWRGGFRTDWKPADMRDVVTIQGEAYRSDSNQLRSVPRLTPPFAVVQHEDITAYGGHLLARWNRELGPDSRFSLQTYLDYTVRDQLPLFLRRTIFDLDAQYELPTFSGNKVIVGAEYRTEHDRFTYTPIITGDDRNKSADVISGFVQDRITLAPGRWFLTVGSKFEHNGYTGFEIQPSARLQWLDGTLQSAWASVARAVRTPSQLEQDLTVRAGTIPPGMLPLPVSVQLQPSPGVESEVLVAYEAGYRRQLTPRVQLDLAAFYNDYEGLATLSLRPPQIILTPPAHVVLPIEITNLTEAETYGMEAVLAWRPMDNFGFSAAYSYLNMELDGPPSAEAIASEGAEGQSPQHQFNLRAQWDVSEDIALDTTVYYVDALPAYRIDSYWRFDTRLGWRLTNNLQIDVVGQNLLDDSHREFGNAGDSTAVVMGRSLYGRLLWRR
jgi:iron complex outermembrane receptor protein